MGTKLKSKENQKLYKICIPKEVDTKIRVLLEDIYNIEWSGILFYNCEGNLTDGITITCKDILPMNIGNSAFTEFEVNEEILPYMVENDLLDCKQGLIHSHHNMSTIFTPGVLGSGTDMETLYKEGKERANFVSLIVNNAGNYAAAITWKEVWSIKSKANLFGIEESFEEVSEETQIYYSLMDVVREIKEPSELLTRIQELKKAKNSIPSTFTSKDVTKEYTNFPGIKTPYIHFNTEDIKKDITTPKSSEVELALEENIPENFSNLIDIPEDILEAGTAQLITGSLTAKRLPQKDLDNILKTIEERFIDRFGTNDLELEDTMSAFTSNVVEGLSTHFAPEESHWVKVEALSQALAPRVSKYKDKLTHLDVVLKNLKDYYEYPQP